MRTLSVFFMLIASLSYAQSTMDYESQLRLRFTDNFLQQLQQLQPEKYNAYISELKCSYEFVVLKPDQKYPELEAWDYHLNQPKVAPAYTPQTFSLYHYRFVRYEKDDMVYRIQGTQQGGFHCSKVVFS